MATTRRTTTRALAPLAALALAATACGGLDLARTETTASEQAEDEGIEDPQAGGEELGEEPDAPDTDASDTDAADTDDADTDPTDEAGTDAPETDTGAPDTDAADPDAGEDGDPVPDAGSQLETGEQDDDAGSGSNRATPEDLDLDLTQRHPGGALLEISGLRFEGNTILIDAEFINGATREVRITTSGGRSLRVQDDVGNTYNFVEPDDVQGTIRLDQGETIRGEFAFLGPVDPRASELVVVTNIYDPVTLPINPDHLYDRTTTPEFAVEGLELSW